MKEVAICEHFDDLNTKNKDIIAKSDTVKI